MWLVLGKRNLCASILFVPCTGTCLPVPCTSRNLFVPFYSFRLCGRSRPMPRLACLDRPCDPAALLCSARAAATAPAPYPYPYPRPTKSDRAAGRCRCRSRVRGAAPARLDAPCSQTRPSPVPSALPATSSGVGPRVHVRPPSHSRRPSGVPASPRRRRPAERDSIAQRRGSRFHSRLLRTGHSSSWFSVSFCFPPLSLSLTHTHSLVVYVYRILILGESDGRTRVACSLAVRFHSCVHTSLSPWWKEKKNLRMRRSFTTLVLDSNPGSITASQKDVCDAWSQIHQCVTHIHTPGSIQAL